MTTEETRMVGLFRRTWNGWAVEFWKAIRNLNFSKYQDIWPLSVWMFLVLKPPLYCQFLLNRSQAVTFNVLKIKTMFWTDFWMTSILWVWTAHLTIHANCLCLQFKRRRSNRIVDKAVACYSMLWWTRVQFC